MRLNQHRLVASCPVTSCIDRRAKRLRGLGRLACSQQVDPALAVFLGSSFFVVSHGFL
jgi:hypothetical protein